MKNTLPPGIYEQVISNGLAQLLDALPAGRKDEGSIDAAEAPAILTDYLAAFLQQALTEVGEGNEAKEALPAQIALANEIISFLQQKRQQAQHDLTEDADAPLIETAGKQLLGITQENDLPLKKNEHLPRPTTSLIETSLFTGARQEPSMFVELKKEIATSDRLDLLVSFIKWSGLILILPEIQAFTERGGKLRVIATSYMGATDVKAIDALARLKGAEIKISYNTKSTRLHAKAYIFHRETGFHTAYIGSSNLSNPALSSGLEWNVKITQHTAPATMKKVTATFDTYWQSPDFEPYTQEKHGLLVAAIDAERHGTSVHESPAGYLFTIRPFAYQRALLDEIAAERELRGNYRNLVVAATGTGKTVLSAFDYLRFRKAHPGEACRLLFVAHREEILAQSLACFRGILRDQNFGTLFVGSHRPTAGDDIGHLFLSIQTFHAQKWWEQTTPQAYDYIIVDEVHHAAAATYQKLFSYYEPKILLGLTATPERMDGRDLLHYFGGHITADLRLFEAIERGMLVPFHYFGVTDTIDLSGLKWSTGGYLTSELNDVYVFSHEIARRRADYIVDSLEKYTTDLTQFHGVGFCVSREHAAFMAECFTARGLPSRALTALTSEEARRTAKDDLTRGRLRFLFVVDLYNEGVDIPAIDTILFLRPTASLTVFLQQLGRGLRLAPGKEFLTVLDFIGQAHRKYRFEEKYTALVRSTKHATREEIEQGFPHMPRGCFVALERQAQKYILENIRAQLVNKNYLLTQLADFGQTGAPLSLDGFLTFAGLPLTKLYKRNMKEGFARLAALAGLRPDFAEPDEQLLTRALPRFAAIDDAAWITFLLALLPRLSSLNEERCAPIDEQRLQMLYFTIWDGSLEEETAAHTIRERLAALSKNRALIEEICELLSYRLAHLKELSLENQLPFACPLRVHAHYTRNQICAALDMLRPTTVRQGVYQVKEKHCDIFFVTLNKSEKDYSPSTLYADYSINDRLFHWESQSTTSDTSPTAQRYFHHRELHHQILLFVREYKEDALGSAPYMFLGPVNHVRHSGSRPVRIIWQLDIPIPAQFLQATNKLVSE